MRHRRPGKARGHHPQLSHRLCHSRVECHRLETHVQPLAHQRRHRHHPVLHADRTRRSSSAGHQVVVNHVQAHDQALRKRRRQLHQQRLQRRHTLVDKQRRLGLAILRNIAACTSAILRCCSRPWNGRPGAIPAQSEQRHPWRKPRCVEHRCLDRGQRLTQLPLIRPPPRGRCRRGTYPDAVPSSEQKCAPPITIVTFLRVWHLVNHCNVAPGLPCCGQAAQAVNRRNPASPAPLRSTRPTHRAARTTPH